MSQVEVFRLGGMPRRIVIDSEISGPRIVSRINQFTGEEIPVEPWVNQIHPEDWDWFVDHWLWMDEFDYRLKMAGVEA